LEGEPPEDVEYTPGQPIETLIIPLTNPVPTSYRLHFEPNFDTFTFKGRADITLKLRNDVPVKRIILNSVGLDIQQASLHRNVEDAASKSNSIGGELYIRFNSSYDLVVFNFASPKDLKGLSSAVLRVEWIGKISTGMDGWYRSAYRNGNITGYIFATQFQPASARKVFPCVDEPYYKSTFSISMIVPSELEAFSNSPVKQITPLVGGKKKLVEYETSALMSTYLVALLVGPFSQESIVVKSCDVKLNSQVPIGSVGSASFALQVANQTLDYYQWYFQQRYVMDKIDLIALPDFGFGAMENWGAITFREQYMLLGKDNPSEIQKQQVAYVVAHEMAHQWYHPLILYLYCAV